MKFGVREIANVVFRAKTKQQIGSTTFEKGQPVFYLDSAKTSSMEGGATTVYATGGRGNARLVTWEGERTLTFTVEDALLSPISFGMLSGAGIIKGKVPAEGANKPKVHFHQYSKAQVQSTTDNSNAINGFYIDLSDALTGDDVICQTAPLYIMKTDEYGDITGELIYGTVATEGDGKGKVINITAGSSGYATDTVFGPVMVDYYVLKNDHVVTELSIDAKHFGGYFYVEADTLFRTKDGKDLPANLTFPNVKIQSNFTFSMSSSGDPSTFTFTMDAMPGYTYFNNTNEVLCAMQVVDDTITVTNEHNRYFKHPAGFTIAESTYDSTKNKTGSDAEPAVQG